MIISVQAIHDSHDVIEFGVMSEPSSRVTTLSNMLTVRWNELLRRQNQDSLSFSHFSCGVELQNNSAQIINVRSVAVEVHVRKKFIAL